MSVCIDIYMHIYFDIKSMNIFIFKFYFSSSFTLHLFASCIRMRPQNNCDCLYIPMY